MLSILLNDNIKLELIPTRVMFYLIQHQQF